MGFRDVVETDERLIVEMDNRPDLTNIRGALQGGLVATLIDIAAPAGGHRDCRDEPCRPRPTGGTLDGASPCGRR